MLTAHFIYENKFDLNENGAVGGTHFCINGLVQRLVLTPRQKATQSDVLKTPFDNSVLLGSESVHWLNK